MSVADSSHTSLTPPEVVVEELVTLKIPWLRGAFWGVLVVGLAPALSPALFLVVWALFGTETVGVLAADATLEWFRLLLASPEWRESLTYSTLLAIVVSATSCAILTVHFFFMRYAPPWVERLGYCLTVIPIILPSIVYALALRIIGGKIGLDEMILIGVGQSVFVIALQYFVLEAAQDKIPNEMMFSASTLGASNITNIIYVYFPALRQSLLQAFLIGFFFSFDEIVIAAFLNESPLVTVPKRLWDQVHRNMDPSPAVIATMLLTLFIAIIITGLLNLCLKRILRLRRWGVSM